MEDNRKCKRHWSFVVTDTKFLFPLTAIIIVFGIALSLFSNDPTQFSRVGNFIIGIGVWMSMRCTLREGINRYKNANDLSPVIPGTGQINSNYFNSIGFYIGDSYLQICGFFVVVVGSTISSYGDLIIKLIL